MATFCKKFSLQGPHCSAQTHIYQNESWVPPDTTLAISGEDVEPINTNVTGKSHISNMKPISDSYHVKLAWYWGGGKFVLATDILSFIMKAQANKESTV